MMLVTVGSIAVCSDALTRSDIALSSHAQARAIGHGSSDWGAIALAVRHSAGMAIPPPPGDDASGSQGPTSTAPMQP